MSSAKYTPEFKDEAVRQVVERHILKKGCAVLCQKRRVKYPFIHEHRHIYSVRMLCRLLGVSRNSYYAWVHNPMSRRAKEDRRLRALIKDFYEASGRVYGSPRIHLDLRELGEIVNKKRVASIMRENNIRAVSGYRIPRKSYSRQSIISGNRRQRQFTVDQPESEHEPTRQLLG